MTLATIVALGDKLRSKEKELAKLAAQAESVMKEIQDISRIDLPEAMQEEGLTAFRLTDGTEIKLHNDFFARITDNTVLLAHEWLRKNGFGGLIKNKVTLTLGRGDDIPARLAASDLREKFGEEAVSLKSEVHPQTLLAFVREQAASGKLPPTDLFNIHPYTVAKVARE